MEIVNRAHHLHFCESISEKSCRKVPKYRRGPRICLGDVKNTITGDSKNITNLKVPT